MAEKNHPPQVVTQYPFNDSRPQNDEIDLRELFLSLWAGKWIIIVTTVLFTVVAVIYALTAQQWWSSTAKVAEPQPQDISAYQQQVKQFQPVFDIYQEDGTIRVSNELNELVNSKVLFNRFLDAFNSNNNKSEFLDASTVFQHYKVELGLPKVTIHPGAIDSKFM